MIPRLKMYQKQALVEFHTTNRSEFVYFSSRCRKLGHKDVWRPLITCFWRLPCPCAGGFWSTLLAGLWETADPSSKRSKYLFPGNTRPQGFHSRCHSYRPNLGPSEWSSVLAPRPRPDTETNDCRKFTKRKSSKSPRRSFRQQNRIKQIEGSWLVAHQWYMMHLSSQSSLPSWEFVRLLNRGFLYEIWFLLSSHICHIEFGRIWSKNFIQETSGLTK